ncbi:CocE/NonD family hydrolase [Spongiactinospora sp. TRM90649]|uniref:CocE/NonD family hydrolase n=1 Tax=Spongiactinospora sp. TRM90649 TaxID=3031114 RepID=UPI0023F81AE0|nr:CocE/NonD family hydrolase [Spongiactinospora sp. TRM90649]MDF5755174.1 CocE/NonD family hydrolase [Spongiactinospora sp. TRM90649]
MTLLSRLLGVRPALRHRVRVRRDVEIPAADGVRLLATHYYPVTRRGSPLVLLRSPYGRGNALDRLPALLAERGYQVLYQSLRGTAGSAGRFDGFVIDPADGDGTLSWLRAQPWFGGELATWGASYLGFAQWELAARDIPEWKIALVQDAPSSFADVFMYPGGAFATGNALGWVQLVERMFTGGYSTIRQMLGLAGAARRLSRATLTLPLQEADRGLTGHPVPWFRDWVRHGPGEPYWASTDHRANVVRMPPVVHLQGGWHDFFLPGMLADYASLSAAGRTVRLLVGPWSHGRGLYTREGLADALAMLDAVLLGRQAPAGVRLFVTGGGRWIDVPAWPPAHEATAWFLNPGGGLSRTPPDCQSSPSRYRYDPADPTPTVGGTQVGMSAGAKDNQRVEARADVLTFTTAPLDEDVEAIGPVRVRLHVRSANPHADYFARVCEVDPRGRSVNVCDGIVRLQEAGPIQAGDIRVADIDLWPMAHRFRGGHRIRLQVSSGAHPRFGRNPGTGEPLATGRELRSSEHEIFHDRSNPSALWLPLTPGAW